MNSKIAFAELTYIQKGTSSKAFPYASALVASYAKKNLEIKLKFSFLSIRKILKII